MKLKLAVAGIFLVLSHSAIAGDLPPPEVTGAINLDVTQANIQETVCTKGYTKTIRPPSYYTSRLKRKQIGSEGNMRDFEEDHLIPLSIGGAPSDEKNLWAQPRNSEFGADKKDELELRLRNLVCAGKLSLKDAQFSISKNWIESYKIFGGEKYHGKGSGD